MGEGGRHLLCNDHANMVPAEGPFRQKVPATFSRQPSQPLSLSGLSIA